MTIQIDLLAPDSQPHYEELLGSVGHSLLYASLPYRDFLKRILAESQDCYLVAYERGEMVGALPAFVKHNPRHGNVLNSLPFYGSNGGVIVSPRASSGPEVKRALVGAFNSLAAEKSAVASTIISNPLDADAAFYEEHTGANLRDERIGQVTALPEYSGDAAALPEALMGMFHQKTRNSIRKAQKSGVVVTHSAAPEDMETLAVLHRQNIEAVGGRPKPRSVFAAVREAFAYDRDYRLYLAEQEGAVIAALLVFFHHRTAEYFTPATLASHRVYQPMSVLVFEAMQEAARRGCRYWNWGGTWATQDGVYQFKSRWGTRDLRYVYYVRECPGEGHLRRLTPREILAEYPYFYVLPFGVLGGDGA